MVPENARVSGDRQLGSGRLRQHKVSIRADVETARRRRALLQQQVQTRENRLADVRRIATEALLAETVENELETEVHVEGEEDVDDGENDVEMDGAAKGEKGRRLRMLNRTVFFARQFQVLDWMTFPPEDLGRSWLLQVRPDGERCLLLSEGGRVQVRKKNGFVLERYTDSRLPRGLTILDCVSMQTPRETAPPAVEPPSPSTPSGVEVACEASDGGSALEDVTAATPDAARPRAGRGARRGRRGCVGRLPGDRAYAVMDVLVWGDVDLVSADAECRMYWLVSRFAELPEKCSKRSRPLRLIKAVPASAVALMQGYQEDFGYVKDSFAFLHCGGAYSISDPVTPLALFWRDRHLSRFVVDTADAKGEVMPERQVVVLELRGGGRLRTADRVLVFQISAEALAEAAKTILPRGEKDIRSLVRCEITGVDVSAEQVTGLRIVSHVPVRSRVWPDSWGRIVFQHLNREGRVENITIEALVNMCGGQGGRQQ